MTGSAAPAGAWLWRAWAAPAARWERAPWAARRAGPAAMLVGAADRAVAVPAALGDEAVVPAVVPARLPEAAVDSAAVASAGAAAPVDLADAAVRVAAVRAAVPAPGPAWRRSATGAEMRAL